MTLIIPTVVIGSNSTVFRWTGMMGSTVLEECDVGEAIDISDFTERSIQLVGSWQGGGNKFALEFNSDPENMPWFGIVPTSAMLLITPGRQYGSAIASVWPNTRFMRPRIATTYNPTGAPIDVLMFCMNRSAV